MFRAILVWYLVLLGVTCYSSEPGYVGCGSIGPLIETETAAIDNSYQEDFSELAQLHVSRGESYLIAKEYEKALDDFHNAYFYLSRVRNQNVLVGVAFRASFGEVVCYDGLGWNKNENVPWRIFKLLQSSSSAITAN